LYEDADELTNYGVQSRYPDPFSSTTQDDVDRAVVMAMRFTELLEPVLAEMLNDE